MNSENDFFLTISKPYGPEELKDKGSRFISYAYPVTQVEGTVTVISALRKKYHDATHVCFAYRIGNGEDTHIRYTDDGEPGGTAGLSIYNEIKNKEYYNIIVAVVRYFGGIKLGTGGLVRAYAGASRQILEITDPIKVYITQKASLTFPYTLTGEMMQLMNRFSLKIIQRDYTDQGITMVLEIPPNLINEVSHAIIDASSGKIQLEI
ncbi:MAG: IMPACT family protein [Candidatus Omnitrophota bacterium]